MMDFTQPQVTVVEKSLKGKTFFIYGTNGTGKTDNAVQFPRPFALPFENGLNAVAGLPYHKPIKWSETKKIVKEFQRPEVKAMYDTILIDTADKMGALLLKYICSVHGVDNIGDANNGFGAYGDINKYLSEFLDGLTNEGYTVVIIGHEKIVNIKDPVTQEKYERFEPRGDKRVIQEICDLVDVIGFTSPNGFDEDGNELMSTIYLKDGKYFKARSRWKHIVPSVTPFNVPNLESAIIQAIKKDEEEKGTDNFVDVKEKVEQEVVIPYEELLEECKEVGKQLKELMGSHKYWLGLVEDKLGEGVKLSETTEKNREVVEEIFESMKEKLQELKSGKVSLPEA